MRQTVSFDQYKRETCELGLFWFDKKKHAPFQFWALLFLNQKPTSAEIVRLFFEESANLEKGEFFNNKCFVLIQHVNERSTPDQVQL